MDILIYGFGNYSSQGFITLYGFGKNPTRRIVLNFSLDIQQNLNIQLNR